MSSGEIEPAKQFDTTQRFKGVVIPRYEGSRNGPMMQSLSWCTCGRPWKEHESVNGYCPARPC